MNEPISVVIPVYRSQSILPELLARLHPVLEARATPFEVILVNDASPDGSWDMIVRLVEQWSNVRGIALSRNYGQHNAVLCGIRAAQHGVIVTMDDDLQHPPEAIPRLLDKLAAGYDLVYAPPLRERHGWYRDGASVLTKLALRHVLGASTAREVTAFRAFRSSLRDGFADYRAPFVSIDVLLSWTTSRVAAVRVRHDPRRQGRSGYNFRKLTAHALNLLTGFSVAPLKLASLVGVLTTLFGVAALGFALVRALVAGSAVPGFLFLTSIITVFSGTQLFALGVVGEYLGRMYLRTMERPCYVVREAVRSAPGHARAA